MDILYVCHTVNPSYREEYRKVKKEYNEKLANFRKNIYNKQILSSDNRSRAVWDTINDIKGKNHTRDNSLHIKGDMQDLANKYNEYLCNVV